MGKYEELIDELDDELDEAEAENLEEDIYMQDDIKERNGEPKEPLYDEEAWENMTEEERLAYEAKELSNRES